MTKTEFEKLARKEAQKYSPIGQISSAALRTVFSRAALFGFDQGVKAVIEMLRTEEANYFSGGYAKHCATFAERKFTEREGGAKDGKIN